MAEDRPKQPASRNC